MENEKRQIARSTQLAAVIIVISIFLSAFLMHTIAKEQNEQTERYLFEIAQQCKNTIVKQINGDLQTLQAIATFVGQNKEVNITTLMPVLQAENDRNGFQRLAYIDMVGRSFVVDTTGGVYCNTDFQDREYVQRALNGEQYVSETLKDRLGDGYINCYSVPIYHQDKLIGALCAMNSVETFRSIVNTPIFDNAGFSHIINSKGDFVVWSTHESANQNFNNIYEMTALKGQAKIQMQQNIESGKSGFIAFDYNNNANWATYVPIGINDWFVVSVVPKIAVNTNFNKIIQLCVLLILGVILLFCILIFYINTVVRKSRQEIAYLAYYDGLTGMYNKTKFVDEATKILSKKNRHFAVIMLDIGNFKFVNELFGFADGDLLLKHVADVLRAEIGCDELCFRDTADRFGALIVYDGEPFLLDRVELMMQKISSYSFENADNYNLVCCCGIKVIEEVYSNADVELLLDGAALALGTAKGSHINRYAFYDAQLHDKVAWRSKVESGMWVSLKQNEFAVYLQPKYDLKHKQIVGSEALVRWDSPTYGLVYPDHFIPVFEQNGFVTELDMYVLKTVCKSLRKWIDKGYAVFPVSVNQSRRLFYQESYLDNLQEILREYAVPPSLIVLEITESIAVEDIDVIRTILEGLHRLGFTVSMDDFGSGYSSLNVLQDIEIDELKLDKAFLSNRNNSQNGAIVQKIVELTKELSISTVAEGVETIGQVEFLESIGCDIAQGYYFAKPMPIDDFETLSFGGKISEIII